MFLFACDARAHIYWPMSELQPIILVPGSFHLNWGMGLEDQKNDSTFEVAVLGFFVQCFPNHGFGILIKALQWP